MALVEGNDPDEVLREIDRLADRRDWQGLLALRQACRRAAERGFQLWGPAAFADYRIACGAPAAMVATVLEAPPNAFSPGPLPEVAAVGDAGRAVLDVLPGGPLAGMVAHELVVAGHDLSRAADLARYVQEFELPLAMCGWEPSPPEVQYGASGGSFPRPALRPVAADALTDPADAVPLDDPDALAAWRGLVAPWVEQSNGSATVAAVHGGPRGAIAALRSGATVLGGVTVPPVLMALQPEDALAWMWWAAADGGARGRRPGRAAGRRKLWHALAAVTGVLDDGPLEGSHLGEAIGPLRWWTWVAGGEQVADGWIVRLVAWDPVDDVSFAIDAADHEV